MLQRDRPYGCQRGHVVAEHFVHHRVVARAAAKVVKRVLVDRHAGADPKVGVKLAAQPCDFALAAHTVQHCIQPQRKQDARVDRALIRSCTWRLDGIEQDALVLALDVGCSPARPDGPRAAATPGPRPAARSGYGWAPARAARPAVCSPHVPLQRQRPPAVHRPLANPRTDAPSIELCALACSCLRPNQSRATHLGGVKSIRALNSSRTRSARIRTIKPRRHENGPLEGGKQGAPYRGRSVRKVTRMDGRTNCWRLASARRAALCASISRHRSNRSALACRSALCAERPQARSRGKAHPVATDSARSRDRSCTGLVRCRSMPADSSSRRSSDAP